MTTLDEKSQAEQDLLADAVHNGTPTLDCTTCGRNCRHVPTMSGGGTAGGIKGEKWGETDRSRLRCPRCGQKPHRKEGRVHQEVMCMWGQVAQRLGLTVLPHPTAAIGETLYNMLAAGEIKPPPTEKQMARLIGGMSPEQALADEPKTPRSKSTTVPQASPGEEVAGMVAAPEILMPELPKIVEAKATAIKVKKTPEEIAAEKAEAKRIRDEEKAAAKAERDRLREEAKAQAKAQREAKKAETKAQKEARLLDRAIADVPTALANQLQEEDDEESVTETQIDDGYDPTAGVGEPWVEDSDQDDDEEELTPAQIAALAKA